MRSYHAFLPRFTFTVAATALLLAVGCSNKKPQLNVLEGAIEDALGQRAEATVEFRSLEVISSDAGAEFVIGLEWPLSSIDCLGWGPSTEEEAEGAIATVHFHRAPKTDSIGHADLLPGGGVAYFPNARADEPDEEASASLSWSESDDGAIRFSLPWDLIPLDSSGATSASVSTSTRFVAKHVEDTWADLQGRYRGSFEVSYPEEDEADEADEGAEGGDAEEAAEDGEAATPETPSVAIVDGQLMIDGEPVTGVIGHNDDLCRYGSTKTGRDRVPGNDEAVLIQR